MMLPDSPSATVRPVPLGVDDPRKTVKCDFEIGRRMTGPTARPAPTAAGPAVACRSCRFYGGTIPGGTFDGRDGLCRRYPPVPVSDGNGEGGWVSRWATTDESSFCGEFAPASSDMGGPASPVEFKGPGPG